MSRSRLRVISTTTLRAWLRALDGVPSYVPLVVDLRIACRNELWRREAIEDGLDDGWLVSGGAE